MKWQYKVRDMLKKRLPALLIANRAAWEKVMKGRAEIRWDNVADKAWKETRRNQEVMPSMEKFWGYKRSKRKDRNKGKASAKK